MKAVVRLSDFCGSFSSLHEMPRDGLPEVAIVGRSNVGKSTFINRLTGRKNLARASQMPGRTQTLVCFRSAVSLPRQGEKNLMLVDLPGYGFAKVARGEKQRLHRLIGDYLQSRETLKVVCLLNDCRRDPEEEEIEIRNLVAEAGPHLLIIANKVDKLTRNEQAKRAPQIAGLYGLEKADILLSGEKVSPDPIWERILSLL